MHRLLALALLACRAPQVALLRLPVAPQLCILFLGTSPPLLQLACSLALGWALPLAGLPGDIASSARQGVAGLPLKQPSQGSATS